MAEALLQGRVLVALHLEGGGMVCVHLCSRALDAPTAIVEPVFAQVRDCEPTVSGGNELNAR